MKKLLACTALSLMSFGAIAADLPARGPAAAPAPVFVAAPTWTGFYAGVQGGYGWGLSEHSYFGRRWSSHGSADVNGGLLGATIGWNFQTGSFVLGVEGDLSAAWLSGSTGGTTVEPCLRFNGTSLVLGGFCKTDLNWLGTVRARAGVAFGAALVYATGGLAFGEVEATRPFVGSGRWDDTRAGWALGAGVEYAFANNWSAKIEYLHVDLGEKRMYPCPTCTTDNHKVSFDADIIRVGLNYKFGGPSAAPVVARY